MSDLVERVARELCVSVGRDPDECMHGSGGTGPTAKIECHLRLWETQVKPARGVVGLVLEEAAKVADGYTPRWIDAEECAAAIRALKIEQGDG